MATETLFSTYLISKKENESQEFEATENDAFDLENSEDNNHNI